MYHLSIIFLYESRNAILCGIAYILHMTKLELITIVLFILIIKLQGVSAQPPEIDVFIQVYSSRII